MDLGHDLRFGAFLPPVAEQADAVLALSGLVEDLGLDVLAFQDHPYQPGFLDTWTLLSFLAARTHRVTLAPVVANVPLRPPAVLARSAASLDVLSHGRVELGLGAGYFLDAMASMGAPRRSALENVEALDEAIRVVRSLWEPGPPVTFEGRHYRLDGARPGPVAPHRIGIWVGSYKRRMLELTGRLADGWVPSSAYASPDELVGMTRRLDAAAVDAGRDPADVRRIYVVQGSFGRGSGFLKGPPRAWAEQLAGLALELGTSTFVVGPGQDTAGDLQRFAEEVAPAVREIVAAERGREEAPPAAQEGASDAVAVTAAHEAQRMVEEEEPVSAVGRAGQQTLVAVHAHLRQELAQLRDVVRQVAEGRRSAASARSHLNQLSMRQNYWTLGSFCAAYCRAVSVHHAIEDARMFPDVLAADASLQPVVDKLSADHEAIAGVLVDVDDALVAMIRDEDRLDAASAAVERLADVLLTHLDYEEEQLLGPIGRLSIQV
ncbi:LLM class flavin-dependent oxidoreductase [Vallicoccus soli]|uniref:LLM class flavin-dependent oxidoreductase n=1 Tax=Vallicoccus soli TaxID=2339232 RepID=A0A3A3Z053_9ACTN|nr:LLM class flavin-dependent oxidoreductase [Vallicoccus soli]RJK94832.1 LLM class flavin-dependent oxidoreductase [Vallicoccus soli]